MTRTGNTVAVIGLGVMGAPMAANLIDAGAAARDAGVAIPLGATAKPSGSTPICPSNATFRVKWRTK